jgi:hypothetical protein
MKKRLISMFVLLAVCMLAFADVSVKQVEDGVEVTFLFSDLSASNVTIAGDFTNWADGAVPMTKTDKGWMYTTVVPAGTVMKYKFLYGGNWVQDFRAPDSIDDGFGGKNGLVDVDAILAASAESVPETSDAIAVAPVKKSAKLHFQTWSMLGYQTKWDTCDESDDNASQFETDSTGINLTSYLKISGDALPNVPIYIEVALAEQSDFDNLYSKGTTSLADGLSNMLVDTAFDPIYYFGGEEEAATYLGHLKLGFDSPYVNYVTGYKYAKLPPHTNVNWNTIDQEWEAGYSEVGGYSQFDFSPILATLLADSGVTVNAVIAPNRSADRAGNQYGMYSYATAKMGNHYVDFQYNGAYGETFDTIFDDIMENDFIAGYQGVYGPLVVKTNALYNLYGSTVATDTIKIAYSPSSSDVSSVDEDPENKLASAAANANATFSSNMFNCTLGYMMRGIQANMMYVENGADDHYDISDQLGYRNTQKVWVDVNAKLVDAITLGVKPSVTMALDSDENVYYDDDQDYYSNSDTKCIDVKPYFTVELEGLVGINGKLEGYGTGSYVTEEDDEYTRGSSESQYLISEAGLKYSMDLDIDAVSSFYVMYGFDNDDEDYLFNTVMASADLMYDITGQCGFGIRSANEDVDDPESPFGFFVGANKPLSILAKPTAYVQFMYGMDPYNDFDDGPTGYNLDGYTLDDGVTDYNGNAAIRMGLVWDL